MPYKDPEKRREHRRQYYAQNIEKRRAMAKAEWAKRDKTYLTQYRRKQRYNLNVGDFERIAAEQGGVCALCGIKPPSTVDHCHETGLNRGLLCHACNIGLGMFGDSPERLKQAIDYIERHRKQDIGMRLTPMSVCPFQH